MDVSVVRVPDSSVKFRNFALLAVHGFDSLLELLTEIKHDGERYTRNELH